MAATIDELIAGQSSDIGDWSEAVDLVTLDNGTSHNDTTAPDTSTTIPYPHKLRIVLGNGLNTCQIPHHPPYNVLVFNLAECLADVETELYMLFGGRRTIESHLYCAANREMLIQFRRPEHLTEALFKQHMNFRSKPLQLALILVNEQIREYLEHDNERHELCEFVPFKDAYEAGVAEFLKFDRDESMSEYEDNASVDLESVCSSQFGQSRQSSNDVRLCNMQSLPTFVPRQRADSLNSTTSLRSASTTYSDFRTPHRIGHYSTLPKHVPFTQHNSPRPLSQAVTPANIVVASSRPPKRKTNPFGEAKPVNTNTKELLVQQKIIEQRQAAKENQQHHQHHGHRKQSGPKVSSPAAEPTTNGEKTQPSPSVNGEKTQPSPSTNGDKTTQPSPSTEPHHNSRRSSPSASLKPNSSNSSMTFCTALSGSEISTVSTELPCVSVSAPPTPNGPSKKKNGNNRKKEKRSTAKLNNLQGNKFRALANAPE